MSLSAARERLRTALGGEIGRVADGYAAFAAQDPPEEAKAFAAHHAACKAALAHLDLLLKLARWAEADQPSAAGSAESDLLAEARAALAADDEEEDPFP